MLVDPVLPDSIVTCRLHQSAVTVSMNVVPFEVPPEDTFVTTLLRLCEVVATVEESRVM
jgi:hypothetical protein